MPPIPFAQLKAPVAVLSRQTKASVLPLLVSLPVVVEARLKKAVPLNEPVVYTKPAESRAIPRPVSLPVPPWP